MSSRKSEYRMKKGRMEYWNIGIMGKGRQGFLLLDYVN